MGQAVHGMNTWDEQSTGQTVRGTNSPGRTARGWIIRGPTVPKPLNWRSLLTLSDRFKKTHL